MIVNQQTLRKFAPRAVEGWVEALDKLAPSLAKHYGFDGLIWRHFMGQIGAETDGLAIANMRESFRYTSASRILQVFSYRLRKATSPGGEMYPDFQSADALARYLVGKPELLADIVYGGREGTPRMQGHLYIGRGPTQITHRNNYQAIRDEIRRQPGGDACPDLVANPAALESPEMGIRSAFADWQIKNLSRWARNDDLHNVSSVLNTGSPGKWSMCNGKENRQRWYARACSVFPGELAFGEPVAVAAVQPVTRMTVGSSGDDVADLQRKLAEKGYHCGAVDGSYGTLTRRAVVALQSEHGIDPTGDADDATIEALEKTAMADLGPRAELTAKDLADRGSTTVKAAQQVTFWGRFLKFLGIGTGGAGGAEMVSPGIISRIIDAISDFAGPLSRIGELISWRTVLMIAGAGILGLGWKLGSAGVDIIIARLKDQRSGANVGR